MAEPIVLTKKSLTGDLIALFLHLPLATVGCMVIMTFLTVFFVAPLIRWSEAPSLSAAVFGGLYSPQVWGPGLTLGFFANRWMLNRSACWVWVAPVIWLAYGIWDECRIYRFPLWFPPKGDFLQRAWHIFFTSDGAKVWGSSPLVLVMFTMPALSSIAYSVGAWLALRSKPTKVGFGQQPIAHGTGGSD